MWAHTPAGGLSRWGAKVFAARSAVAHFLKGLVPISRSSAVR